MSGAQAAAAAGSRIVVAVDGSSQSIVAAEEACSFLKEEDTVWAVTVDDPDKDYLPDEFLPAHIEKDCGSLFSALPEENYRYEAPELLPSSGQTVFGILKRVCHDKQARFFFCGSVGRKGPKLATSVLGRVADTSLKQLGCTSVIVKRKSPIEKAVACCLDGSARSFAALDQLLRFMRATEHEIVILHVVPGSSNDPSSHTAQIVKWAKQMVSSAPEMSKADIRFETIECEEPSLIGPTILEFAQKKRVDYIMLGSDGRGAEHDESLRSSYGGHEKTKLGDGGGIAQSDDVALCAEKMQGWDRRAVLGSVADFLVRVAPCNIMICDSIPPPMVEWQKEEEGE